MADTQQRRGRLSEWSGPAGRCTYGRVWRLPVSGYVLVGDLTRMIGGSDIASTVVLALGLGGSSGGRELSHRRAPWAVRQLGGSGGGGARCNFGSSGPSRS